MADSIFSMDRVSEESELLGLDEEELDLPDDDPLVSPVLSSKS